jgi:hypothetical protein
MSVCLHSSLLSQTIPTNYGFRPLRQIEDQIDRNIYVIAYEANLKIHSLHLYVKYGAHISVMISHFVLKFETVYPYGTCCTAGPVIVFPAGV